MVLETIQLEHLPAGYTAHIALYRDIKNAAFLHQQLPAGNTSFEYALIDASIVSPSSISHAWLPFRFFPANFIAPRDSPLFTDRIQNPRPSSHLPSNQRPNIESSEKPKRAFRNRLLIKSKQQRMSFPLSSSPQT
jgi:EKC/KEOPS complex subunit CGI121/TPRKB